MLQAILFSILLSLDAFTTSISYGISKIKIPVLSGCIISIMGACFLGISFLLSFFLKDWIDPTISRWVSFGILFLLGCHNLFGTFIKKYFQKKTKNIEFTVANIRIMLSIYADTTRADYDHSQDLSKKEAMLLGIALSVDSLATGFSVGLGDISYGLFLGFAILFNSLAIILGSYLGKLVSKRIDFSWFSGVVLIVLACLRFL